MVKEVLLVGDKKHPREHKTEKCYRWQIRHHHEATDEEPALSCREPGEECVDGLILCKGHALEAKLEGQISCWDEMLFHVDLWSREASRRENPNVVRLLEDQRVEATSAMQRARVDLDIVRRESPQGTWRSRASAEELRRAPLLPSGALRHFRGLRHR